MVDKNAVATQTPMDLAIDNKFIDGLSSQLTKKEQFGLTFPVNYNVSNALNSAYLILQETVDRDKKCVLVSCSKQSIASSLMDMAVQGLNPMKKQCYFVPYNGKLTLMRSYQGTMAVAKRVGAKRIVAEVIYKGDVFEYHIEDGIKVVDKHEQNFQNIDNDNILGAYAIVSMDEYTHTEIMNITQIEKAWSKSFGYKKGQGVHGEFADQMAKKTVISRACKNFINSSDDANLLEAFENTSANDDTDFVAGEVQHDIETNANTEEFSEPEVVHGEVVETPKKSEAKQQKPPVKNPEVPDWMEQEG